jgi:hypothetical protein
VNGFGGSCAGISRADGNTSSSSCSTTIRPGASAAAATVAAAADTTAFVSFGTRGNNKNTGRSNSARGNQTHITRTAQKANASTTSLEKLQFMTRCGGRVVQISVVCSANGAATVTHSDGRTSNSSASTDSTNTAGVDPSVVVMNSKYGYQYELQSDVYLPGLSEAGAAMLQAHSHPKKLIEEFVWPCLRSR